MQSKRYVQLEKLRGRTQMDPQVGGTSSTIGEFQCTSLVEDTLATCGLPSTSKITPTVEDTQSTTLRFESTLKNTPLFEVTPQTTSQFGGTTSFTCQSQGMSSIAPPIEGT